MPEVPKVWSHICQVCVAASLASCIRSFSLGSLFFKVDLCFKNFWEKTAVTLNLFNPYLLPERLRAFAHFAPECHHKKNLPTCKIKYGSGADDFLTNDNWSNQMTMANLFAFIWLYLIFLWSFFASSRKIGKTLWQLPTIATILKKIFVTEFCVRSKPSSLFWINRN